MFLHLPLTICLSVVLTGLAVTDYRVFLLWAWFCWDSLGQAVSGYGRGSGKSDLWTWLCQTSLGSNFLWEVRMEWGGGLGHRICFWVQLWTPGVPVMVVLGQGGLTYEPGCVRTPWCQAISGREGLDHRICSRVQMRTEIFFFTFLECLYYLCYLLGCIPLYFLSYYLPLPGSCQGL